MLQFALTFWLCFCLLIVGPLWVRRSRGTVAVPQHIRRVLKAAERAGSSALVQRAKGLVVPLLLASLIAVGALAICRAHSHAWPGLGLLIAVPLLVAAGAALTLAIARLCVFQVRSASFVVNCSAEYGAHRAMPILWAAAAEQLVTAEILGILAPLGLHWLVGSLAQHVETSPTVAPPQLLASLQIQAPLVLCLGAAVAAQWLRHMGATYLGGAQLGGARVFESLTGINATDTRNPSVLASVLSLQLGELLPRVLDALVSGCLVSGLALLLLLPNSPTSVPPVYAAVPLLFRGFGLFATLAGVLSMRARQHEQPRAAIGRCHVVAQIVFGAAAIGSTTWIVSNWDYSLVIALLLGIGALPLLHKLTHAAPSLVSERFSKSCPADNNTEQAECPPECDYPRQTARALLTLLLLSAIMFFAYWEKSSHPGKSGLLAIVVGLSAAPALSSLYAISGYSLSLLETATLAASLGRTPSDANAPQLRPQNLTGALSKTAQCFAPVASDSGILFCALCAFLLQERWGAFDSGTALHASSVLVVAPLAFIPGITSLTGQIRDALRSVKTQAAEVRRQLTVLQTQGTHLGLPDDYVPSYRSCIELLARDSAKGGLLSLALTLLPPLLSVIADARRQNSPGSPATLLAMYASVVAVLGLAAQQLPQIAPAPATLNANLRTHQLPSGSPEKMGSLSPRELVGFLCRSVVVSIPLLTKASTLVVLAIAAMLA